MADHPKPPLSRIQQKNRELILKGALAVFSANGFRGATIDQIAEASGLSKPNVLYYFASKDEIHRTLLTTLLDMWLAPMLRINPQGEPLAEVLAYVQAKLEMSRRFPRESRLFAHEILQGAPTCPRSWAAACARWWTGQRRSCRGGWRKAALPRSSRAT